MNHPEMAKFLFFSILFVLLSAVLQAQDCTTPGQLCNNAPIGGSFDEFQPVDFDCFDHPYTAYFTFTTNNIQENTGNVNVMVYGIECLGPDGPDSLFVVVAGIEAGGDPCIPVSYVPLSPCGEGDFEIIIGSEELEPSTSYLVIVGTDHDPADGDCDFEIVVSGPAVSLAACCDEQIFLGEQVDLSVSGGNAVPGYTWSPSITLDTSTGTDVVATPGETTEYTVTGNVGPCNNVEAIINIVVGPPVGIPNTFTPNGDGINDLWRIAGISQFPNAQVTVFDRWGQIVFKDIGYAQPWDGTNNGRKLPTATYYYVIELNSLVIEIPPISGAITLIH